MGSGAERSTSAENQTDPLPGFDTNRLFAVLVKNTQQVKAEDKRFRADE